MRSVRGPRRGRIRTRNLRESELLRTWRGGGAIGEELAHGVVDFGTFFYSWSVLGTVSRLERALIVAISTP